MAPSLRMLPGNEWRTQVSGMIDSEQRATADSGEYNGDVKWKENNKIENEVASYLVVRLYNLLMSSFVFQLHGAADPKEIIEKLRVLPNLRILNLDHSALGDEGSKVLFRWLSYGDDDGVNEENNGCLSRPSGLLQLTDICVTGARLGDSMGFSALVGWLERIKKWHQMSMSISPSSSPDGISGLRGLHLQNNSINGTSELALSFVSSLSFHKTDSDPYIFSSLSFLNLSNNPLSSEFKQALFSSLPSLASLRSLFIYLTGLNQTDADTIAAYIGHCRLTDFNASGNNIGYRGLKKILKAMKRCYTLESVDIMCGNLKDASDDDSSDDSDEEENSRYPNRQKGQLERGAWRRLHFERRLLQILSRNLYLKGTVRDQAFELLRSSRLLLLNRRSANDSELDLLVELVAKEEPHSSCSIHQHNCECLPTFRAPSPVSINDPHTSNSHFPFTRLPIEIQLTVLSQLAPILSSSQQIRIFEHAVDKTTLSLHFNGPGAWNRTICGNLANIYDIYGPRFSVAIFAREKEEKERWLDLVKCDAYDPNL